MPVETSDEIVRALVAFASEPMTILDERGALVFVNDAAQRLTAYPDHECIGRSFVDLVHVEEQDHVHDAFSRALATFELTQAIQYRLRVYDGQWIWIESRMRSVRDGADPFVLIYSRDVRSSRQLEERLRHAKKLNLLGRLAIEIAVDLEQVVSTIRGHLPGVVELTAGQPASLSLHAILRATERAASLTRQMRGLYETTPLLLEQVDVHALLGDVKRLTTDDEWLRLTLRATRTHVRTDWVALVLGLRESDSGVPAAPAGPVRGGDYDVESVGRARSGRTRRRVDRVPDH